ncbi:c-type cytochrome [Pandoraea terrae]|uniref:c-type cytochrome n=1 Tax=Pandoraea terrae TaxID=1537710 RepID=UPI001CD1D68E|nr:c-type cytochrome [Pandoraea terrae]
MFALALPALTLLAGSAVAQTAPHSGIGRAATPAEIQAWNIDVRPDFEGLPKGSGTVAHGQTIWEGKCATCHGTFGESSEVFGPLVGGTTKDDMKTGRAATLASPQPLRSTLSKDSTLSTLWDYIHRAMPWNAPKSLSNDDVYAVLAYLLNLGDIVPPDFTLSDQNIRDVQKMMPNRNGMTRDHGMWDIKGKPDTHNVACMKDCATDVKIVSSLPDSVRNFWGNLADQNRPFGEARGAETTKPPGTKPPLVSQLSPAAAAATSGGGSPAKASFSDLASKSGCLACHGVSNKIVGPAFQDVAAKYKGDTNAEAQLITKVTHGGSGVWGAVPMPPQGQIKHDDIKMLVQWVLSGAH